MRRIYILHKLNGHVLRCIGPESDERITQALDACAEIQAQANREAVEECLAPTAYVPVGIVAADTVTARPAGVKLKSWAEVVCNVPRRF